MVRINVSLIIPYDRAGRFLLQHRSRDAAYLPGYWAFFGGKCEAGEDARQAVVREAQEELELRLARPALVLQKQFRTPRACGTIYVFTRRLVGASAGLVQHEGQGMGWFGLSETKKLRMVSRDRVILNRLTRYLRRRSQRKTR